MRNRLTALVSPWLLACLLFLVGGSSSAFAQQLRIVHINVGQGDATLIVGPSKTLLFDAGPTGAGSRIKQVMSGLGLSAIDYFVAGHYHEDHIGGVDELLKGGVSLTTASYDRGGTYNTQTFIDYLKGVGRKRSTLALNQKIDLGGGCILTCIAINGKTNHGTVRPSGENDRSIALILRYGTFDYFIASDLTGGGTTDGVATSDVESLVAPDAGDVDVMHVGHHGSNTSSNQNLIDTLQPEQAVISCGDGNSFGHPTQAVLNRLAGAPTMDTIWQTEAGAGGSSPKVRVGNDITFLTDGSAYSVQISKTGQTFQYQTDDEGGADIVINEVAWAGSTSSGYDEWLELHNLSSAAIDLTGWTLVDDGGAQVYTLAGTIAAQGYYLIEQSAGSTSVNGDRVDASLSLANAGDSLELRDAAGNRVDTVNPLGGAWYAGSTSGYYSMERIDASSRGDDPTNWASNNGGTRNGTDSGGKAINGTPRGRNSVATGP